MYKFFKLILVSLLLLISSISTAQSEKPNLLVFSHTEAFRHNSIASGIRALWDISQEQNWNITATEDASLFNDDFLQGFDVVVWLNTTGDVLNENQQQAFQKFLRSGNGFVGIHSAADTEHDWPWYGELLGGAWFRSHPPTQLGTLLIEDTAHPAMEIFADLSMQTWTAVDEWYAHKANPRAHVNVLMTLEESSIKNLGGRPGEEVLMVGDHPMAWYHEFEGGRVFYTNRGHTAESFDDPVMREHLRGAIQWAANSN